MARRKIPTALAMRSLKYGESTDAEKDEMAETLRKAGRRAEALLLYENRPDHPALREEAAWAVSEGDGFHLLSVRRIGREVTEQELRDCAASACERGRWMDARQCYDALDDPEGLARIDEHLPPALRKVEGSGADPATNGEAGADADG